MTNYRFGDVILVPFPFTDQSTSKKRPAVVVSGDFYHRAGEDLIILAITSQTRRRRALDREIENWRDAGLLKPSMLKPVITTIQAKLVLRKLGEISEHDRNVVRELLQVMLSS